MKILVMGLSIIFGIALLAIAATLTSIAVKAEPKLYYEDLCDLKQRSAISDCDKYKRMFNWSLEQRDDCYLDADAVKRLCLDAYRYEVQHPWIGRGL